MNKHFFGILLLLGMAGFLILPQNCCADAQLSDKNTYYLLDSTQQALINEWIDLTTSPDFSEPEKQAALFLIRNAIQKKGLNLAFKELPIQGIEKIIKTAISLGVSPSASVILDKIEKETVKKAVQITEDWLLQNQIKVSSGTLSDSFTSYKGNVQKPVYHYNLAYSPEIDKYGELSIEFYSPEEIEPREPTINTLGFGRSCWEFDSWKLQGNEKIDPFIIRIKGRVIEGQSGGFRWDKTQNIEITFSEPVPSVPKQKLSDRIARIPIIGSYFKDLKTEFEKIYAIIEMVKNFHFGAGLVQVPTSKEAKEVPDETRSRPRADENGSRPSLVEDGPPPISPSLAEIQEQLDDIAEMLDILSQRVAEKTAKARKITENSSPSKLDREDGDGIGDEEKIIVKKTEEEGKIELAVKDIIYTAAICEKNASASPLQNKVIFNEIAWMGTTNSSQDEWIELINVSNTTINLTGWQIVDKTQNIAVIFGTEYAISRNGFFLLERTDDNSVPNVAADLIYTGSLNNTNETLYLFDQNCILQDEIIANPNWQAGNNSSKRTMERKSNLLWQTSKNPNGTPKTKNSRGYSGGGGGGGGTPPPPPIQNPDPEPAPKILITEVQIDAEKSSYDFIELYNPSAQSVDISKYQLKKRTQAGSEYSIRIIPEGTIIQSKNYILWASSKDGYHEIVLSEIHSTGYLIENNSITLLDKDKNIIDAVAWGIEHINPFQETAPFSQNPGENQTIGRKWISQTQEYQDTDKNQDDFQLQFPTPKAENQEFRDIISPNTIIDSQPDEITNQTQARFTFSASEQDCSFEYQINSDGWQSCESPFIYPDLLADGVHFFEVRAIDAEQNIDPSPAQYQWEIDTLPPVTQILTHPPILTNQTQADFVFSASEENCSFECQIDGCGWEDCQTLQTQNYLNLPETEHIFSIRSTDRAGNQETNPLQFVWTINASIENPYLSLSDSDSGSLLYTNNKTVVVAISQDTDACFWLLSENEAECDNPSAIWLPETEKPCQFSLSDTDGSKIVYLWVKDQINNISPGISASIILDTTAPVVEFNNLAPIQTSTEIFITWSGQDNISGISEYYLKIREQSELESDEYIVISEQSYQFSNGINGNKYYFKIQAKDRAENLSDWSSEIFCEILQPVLGVLPEKLKFTAIEFSENPSSQILTIKNIGFGDLNWEIILPEPQAKWLNIESFSGMATVDTPSNIQISVDISGMEPAQFTVFLEISSDAGLKEIEIILDIQEDVTPPEPPQILSHQDNQILSDGNITLSGATEPNALILIASVEEIRADEQGNWEEKITLQEGGNIIEIRAEDEAGNQSEPATITLILDTNPPLAVFNEIDGLQPTLSFDIIWSGDDSNGDLVTSGIQGFQMRYSENQDNWTYFPAENEYILDTSYNFTGEDGKTYYFQLKAKDNAENESEWIEISTTISLPFPALAVVINEIAWMGTGAHFSDEWIELYNNTDEDIKFEGWTLSASDGTPEIGLDGEIFAQGYFLLERTDNQTVADIVAGQIYTGALGDQGEKLELRDNYGNLIDAVDCSAEWFAGDNASKQTMERVISDAHGTDTENWANNNIITRNGSHAQSGSINGTPKQENSVSKSSTQISGALPFNDEITEITLSYFGSPYIIPSTLTIPANKTLIIEPGVILKFGPPPSGKRSRDSIIVNGTFIAQGTEEKNIVFTSITEPEWWSRIYFSPTAGENSILEYCHIKYSGKRWAGSRVIGVNSSSIQIKDTIIENFDISGLELIDSSSVIDNILMENNGSGTFIRIVGGAPEITNSIFKNGALAINIEDSPAIITNNHFENFDYVEGPVMVKNGYPIFSGNTAVNNFFNGIYILGDISSDWTLNKDLVYSIGKINVLELKTLTMDPGVILKFKTDGGIDVFGTLDARGESDEQIIFTSRTDDSYGGDTNNDSDATSPCAGYWNRIHFQNASNTSFFENVIVSYGKGYSGGDAKGQIYAQNSDIEFRNVEIKNSSSGVYLENSEYQIYDSEFISCGTGYTCLAIKDSNGSISDSIFSHNSNIAIKIINENPVFSNVRIENNNYGIYAINLVSAVECPDLSEGRVLFGNEENETANTTNILPASCE